MANATVQLLKNGVEIASTETDAFGDFKFEGLKTDGASYRVVIAAPGRPAQIKETVLAESTYLGVVYV